MIISIEVRLNHPFNCFHTSMEGFNDCYHIKANLKICNNFI